MLTVSSPLRATTVLIPLRMNTERCQQEEGHSSHAVSISFGSKVITKVKVVKEICLIKCNHSTKIGAVLVALTATGHNTERPSYTVFDCRDTCYYWRTANDTICFLRR